MRTLNQADLHLLSSLVRLTLQMSKAAGLDHYLGAESKNLVCRDQNAGYYILKPSMTQLDS